MRACRGVRADAPGAIAPIFTDRVSPFEDFDRACAELVDVDLPLALRYFGGAGLAHMDKYGTTLADFAKVRAKASRHAANNPLSVFRNVMTEEDVLAAQMIWPGVMTRPMGVPADMRCCGSFGRIARFRHKERSRPVCPHRRPGHDDRQAHHARSGRHDPSGRQRDDATRRQGGIRKVGASGPRISGSPSCMTASRTTR
ncbi:MAG: hypothetical protein WDM81_03010 [Rhizomicrobium sp.]